jgi:hypothetical protein
VEAKLVTDATLHFIMHSHERDINLNEIRLNFSLMFKITPQCPVHGE